MPTTFTLSGNAFVVADLGMQYRKSEGLLREFFCLRPAMRFSGPGDAEIKKARGQDMIPMFPVLMVRCLLFFFCLFLSVLPDSYF